jgi:hypothetical protein
MDNHRQQEKKKVIDTLFLRIGPAQADPDNISLKFKRAILEKMAI